MGSKKKQLLSLKSKEREGCLWKERVVVKVAAGCWVSVPRTECAINFPCSADHEQNWQPYSVDPYPCYMCDHTYIDRGHRSQEKPNRGCSGQFMSFPSCERGPSRERDRNSTSRSGSRRRGREKGAGGGGGGVGAGVLDSENNGRICWQPSLIVRLSLARPTEGSEECAWELYLASNQSSRAPSTYTVGRSFCKIFKPKKVRR